MLEIERWKTGAAFAYSLIYENAFEVLLRHSVPMHDEFLMPAGVAVVAGQVGEIHNVPGSPYHLLHRHLNVQELRDLLAKGWSVSSHSMTHGRIGEDLYREVAGSKAALDEALATDTTLFVLPEAEMELVQLGVYARQHGYLAMLSVCDHLNQADDDLFCLGRIPLAEEGPPPGRRGFDPYDRLCLAREQKTWIIDCTQYASPEPMCPDREVTLASLARRFEKVREIGGTDVWCATPEEILDYTLTRRATRVLPGEGAVDGNTYLIALKGLDGRVKRRTLTFRVSGLREGEARRNPVEDMTARRGLPASRVTGDAIWFEAEVYDGLKLRVPDA